MYIDRSIRTLEGFFPGPVNRYIESRIGSQKPELLAHTCKVIERIQFHASTLLIVRLGNINFSTDEF